MAVKFWRVITTTKNVEDGIGGWVEFEGTKKACMENFEKWFDVPGTVKVEIQRVDGNRYSTVAKLERTYEEAKAMLKIEKEKEFQEVVERHADRYDEIAYACAMIAGTEKRAKTFKRQGRDKKAAEAWGVAHGMREMLYALEKVGRKEVDTIIEHLEK